MAEVENPRAASPWAAPGGTSARRRSPSRRLAPWRSGLRRALARPGLVLSVYLASALPALIWLLALAPSLFDGLNRRPAAAGLLEGSPLEVWLELVLSGDYHPEAAMLLLPLLAVLAFLIQLAVTGAVVHSLLHSTAAPPAAFWAAMGRYFVRFLRSFLVFFVALAVILVLPVGAIWIGGKLADSTGDGRWFYGFAMLGLVIFYPLFAWLDLAYDLSRIAAVHHSQRSMVRGYLRAAVWVLRRPGALGLLHLVFVLSLLVVQGIYIAIRLPWAPGTAWAIAFLVLLQQVVLFARAGLQVAFWATLIEAYRRGGTPPLARPRHPKRPRRETTEDLSAGGHTPSQAIPTVS